MINCTNDGHEFILPNNHQKLEFNILKQTFTVELDNMERMLIQMELAVMAGDHESYRISANENKNH